MGNDLITILADISIVRSKHRHKTDFTEIQLAIRNLAMRNKTGFVRMSSKK